MREPVGAAEVALRLDAIRARLADAGGDPASIEIVAVTKGFTATAVRWALHVGLTHVGENYAEEAVAKHAEVGDSTAIWHFLGRLQRNKIRLLAPFVGLWQSIDRAEVVAELAVRAPGAAILVQVNPLDDPSKGGCAIRELDDLVFRARDAGLDVRGLMAVGSEGDLAATERAFGVVNELAERLGLGERSLGMSDDLEVAARVGTTMVRVGRALFGER